MFKVNVLEMRFVCWNIVFLWVSWLVLYFFVDVMFYLVRVVIGYVVVFVFFD